MLGNGKGLELSRGRLRSQEEIFFPVCVDGRLSGITLFYLVFRPGALQMSHCAWQVKLCSTGRPCCVVALTGSVVSD